MRKRLCVGLFSPLRGLQRTSRCFTPQLLTPPKSPDLDLNCVETEGRKKGARGREQERKARERKREREEGV